jgi:hypothetical protein
METIATRRGHEFGHSATTDARKQEGTHVVVVFWVVDAEADGHHVQKGKAGSGQPHRGKVGSWRERPP